MYIDESGFSHDMPELMDIQLKDNDVMGLTIGVRRAERMLSVP